MNIFIKPASNKLSLWAYKDKKNFNKYILQLFFELGRHTLNTLERYAYMTFAFRQ